MNVTGRLRCACAAAALAAILPSSAAAVPGNLGAGARPAIAMDGAGTAYIAYNGLQPVGATTLHFCRLPRNATTCANATTILSPSGTGGGQPFVSVDGATVRIISHRYGGDVPGFAAVYLFVSTNSGDTFGPGTQIGTVPFRDAVVGPADGFSLVTSAFAGGGVFQRVPSGAGPQVTTSAQLSPITHVYEGAVGLADASTPVVTLTDGSGAGKTWRCENCVGLKDPNVLANWTGGNDIGNADDAHFAGGPNGLFLKTSDQLSGGSLIVRKYAGAGTFGAPVTIPGGTGDHPQSHITQDGGGRLHLLWPRTDSDAIRLWYATSDDGSAWQTGAIYQGTEVFSQVRVAAAPDHIGLAVWQAGTGAATEVHFMPMGPTPPQPVPVPPPVVTPPTATPPATYAGRVQGVTGTDRDADYTLGVPRDCVQPGQRFRVTLKWKRKKRKGSLFVKVNRTDFYLATKVVKKDTKVPYVHTYTVLVTQPRGSTINLRARAFIKVKRGKAPKKSIRARVRVCS